MPLTRPTLSELVTRNLSDIETSAGFASPILPVSVLRVLGKVFAGAVHLLYGYVEWMSRQIFPDTAEAEYLDRWASIWGMSRQAATFASCNLVCTGQNGTVVPAGTAWISTGGVTYISSALGTISGGSVTVAAAAQSSGSIGDVASGDVLTLVSPIAGIDSGATVSGSGIVLGQDNEADSALLTRLLERIKNPPQGGSLSDYISWARAVPGVTRAYAYGNYSGAGTVGVTFMMDDTVGGPIPDDATVAAVAAYIETVRPVTAQVTVFKPTAHNIGASITMTGATDAIKAAVHDGLQAYINDNGYPGQTLLVTRMIQAIAENAGSLDFHMSLPASNVTIEEYEFGLLTNVTWS